MIHWPLVYDLRCTMLSCFTQSVLPETGQQNVRLLELAVTGGSANL